MKNKHTGFTIIELLVVITIVGIIATIGTATLRSNIQKANDTTRLSNMQNILDIIRRDSVVTRNGEKMFIYDADSIEEILADANYAAETAGEKFCYFIGLAEGESSAGHDNEIVIATWGESSSTIDGNQPGVLAVGTKQAVFNITNTPSLSNCTPSDVINNLCPEDFFCTLPGNLIKAQAAFKCGQTTTCP